MAFIRTRGKESSGCAWMALEFMIETRKEIWIRAYIACASDAKWNQDGCSESFADFALRKFDERFPESSEEFIKKTATKLFSTTGGCIVGQTELENIIREVLKEINYSHLPVWNK